MTRAPVEAAISIKNVVGNKPATYFQKGRYHRCGHTMAFFTDRQELALVETAYRASNNTLA
jgi:hypothetical protein